MPLLAEPFVQKEVKEIFKEQSVKRKELREAIEIIARDERTNLEELTKDYERIHQKFLDYIRFTEKQRKRFLSVKPQSDNKEVKK